MVRWWRGTATDLRNTPGRLHTPVFPVEGASHFHGVHHPACAVNGMAAGAAGALVADEAVKNFWKRKAAFSPARMKAAMRSIPAARRSSLQCGGVAGVREGAGGSENVS